jgi:hypothetical protein
MIYSKCWKKEDVESYFTTESRDKNRGIFERTHLPIEKILVDFSKDVQKEFITENDLRKLILNSVPEDHNRIFLIVGETGCGKSELCQWLEYNITDKVHIPLHISRSDTKIEDIAGILNSHLPAELRETEEFNELTDVNPEQRARSKRISCLPCFPFHKLSSEVCSYKLPCHSLIEDVPKSRQVDPQCVLYLLTAHDCPAL